MAETIAQQFLGHPRRNWIVGILTAMIVVLFGLPAYDSIKARRKEYVDFSSQLTEIKNSVEQLPPLRKQLEEITHGASGKPATVDKETADALREKVVRMIRDRDCRVRRVSLSDPQSRPWSKIDDPFAKTTPNGGTNTEFQLTATQLSVSASGTLPNLSQILADVSNMHEFAVPTRMTLRDDGNDKTVSLEMEFSLFHLDRKTP